MTALLDKIQYFLLTYWNYEETWRLFFLIFPIVFFIEIPLYSLIVFSYMRKFWEYVFIPVTTTFYYPDVTCVITCYNEGEAIRLTIESFVEQLYKGNIEILVIIDGADVNKKTVEAALSCAKKYERGYGNRYIRIIPKKQRGGRVSSNNLGLKLAKGEIFILIDGDCSADNDLIASVVSGFHDKNVIGSSGNIRVRNSRKSLVTRFQTLEYMIGLQLSKTGLAGLKMLNNISGAFGIFRKDFVLKMGGWRNGTAEDLDMTTRIKVYLKQYPELKIIHSYQATLHTDVPETWKALLKQRMRWDGDISYLYFKRYSKLLRPLNVGWRSLFGIFWYDFFFCLCVPFLAIIYVIYLLVVYSIAFAATMFIVTYLYYLTTTTMLFTLYILFVSERKRKDMGFVWVIPLMPLYQFIMRVWTAIATICEFAISTHKDSRMAPWWVIKKTH